MKALHVFPVYPGDPTDGSAVYQRQLSLALARAGVDVEILATRTRRFIGHGAFDLGWPDELAANDRADGLTIRRLRAVKRFPLGDYASRRVMRQWQEEQKEDGKVLLGSRNYQSSMFLRARRRPRIVDLLAELGRGPVVPSLVRRLPVMLRDKDVVLVGYAPLALMRHVEMIAHWAGKPVVLLPFFHDQDPYHHFEILYRAYERADAVLMLSPHTEDVFRRYLPQSRPVTVGAGVEIGPFVDLAMDGGKFRDRHGLRGRKILLFVGRKEATKRYDLLLEALERLPGDVTLVMIGKDVDQQPLTAERVLYLGNVGREELIAAYDACDVFALPSEHESFGMVILEAWLRRKPVLGNAQCGAVSSLIDDGQDGLLCSSAADFADAAIELLANDVKRRRFGEAGYRKVREEFTWDRVAARTLRAYDQAIRGTKGSSPVVSGAWSATSAPR